MLSKHSPITVFMQNHRLSPQEMRVVAGALRELSNDEIAQELGCSSSTVRTYWARIFEKVGCSREHHVLARIARFASQSTRDADLAPSGVSPTAPSVASNGS